MILVNILHVCNKHFNIQIGQNKYSKCVNFPKFCLKFEKKVQKNLQISVHVLTKAASDLNQYYLNQFNESRKIAINLLTLIYKIKTVFDSGNIVGNSWAAFQKSAYTFLEITKT